MGNIKPQIVEAICDKNYDGRFKIVDWADELGNLKDKNYGDTVSFPTWDDIGDAEDYTKGKKSNPEEMGQSSREAKVKMIDKSVRVYDYELSTALGDNHIEVASGKITKKLIKKLDQELALEMQTNGLKAPCTDKINVTDADLKKGLQYFGDDRDIEDFQGILINSLSLPSFEEMDGFVNMDKSYNKLDNGIVRNKGVVGYYRGIPVVMCDNGTYDNVKNECITYIVKKHAVGYMPKKDVAKKGSGIKVVTEREEKEFCEDIIGTLLYATRLVNQQGVVVIKNSNTVPTGK